MVIYRPFRGFRPARPSKVQKVKFGPPFICAEMSNYIPICLAYQEDLLKAIDGGTILSPCPACGNLFLVAHHPHRPAEPSRGAAFTPSAPIVYTVAVPDIPDGLNFDCTKSNKASSIFVTDELRDWFRNLINPIDFVFEHPEDTILNVSCDFIDYKHEIIAEGFTIWDTQGGADANVRLQLQSPDGRRVVVSGRPDFLICDGDSTIGTYLNKTRCIVEIESKDDEELCQLQMMAYLYIFMNKLGLEKVIGFLISKNGLVRAYRASRIPTNIVYEENDTFHISHLTEVFNRIINM